MANVMQAKPGRTPVIIDTDPGVDDILAILLALASPEIDIRAIIVTFGNTDVDACYLNVLRLSKVLSQQFAADAGSAARFSNFNSERKIILARGSDRPIAGDIHSAQYFHGRDGLGCISERFSDFDVDPNNPSAYPNLIFSDKPGIEVALDVLNSEPERSVTYIALGPLTTLAHLARQHGEVLSARIGHVACMGGNLDVPGNTSPVAEFNFFADPYAVRELLNPPEGATRIPLERFMLIPLDITTPHEIPFPFYQAQIDPTFVDTTSPSDPRVKSPLLHFTSAFLERSREVMLAFGKDAMELHDIVAVWFAIENPPSREVTPGLLPSLAKSWRANKRRFVVEREGEITRGMLVVDRRGQEGVYDPGANRAAIQAELERHIFQSPGIMESTAIPAQVELEAPPKPHDSHGVPVLIQTPGPETLLKLLTKRIWGIDFHG